MLLLPEDNTVDGFQIEFWLSGGIEAMARIITLRSSGDGLIVPCGGIFWIRQSRFSLDTSWYEVDFDQILILPPKAISGLQIVKFVYASGVFPRTLMAQYCAYNVFLIAIPRSWIARKRTCEIEKTWGTVVGWGELNGMCIDWIYDRRWLSRRFGRCSWKRL